jgi:hypothetical protein
MKTKITLVVLCTLSLSAAAVSAQEFWDKKPYTEWSEKECRKLLQDSPWASHTGSVSVQYVPLGQTSEGEGRQPEKKIDYYAHLRSALPVRQAVVRMAMIQNKYDKMTPEQKKLFDQSVEAYLNRDFSNVIVVHVDYGSNVKMIDTELARIWQGYPAESVPINVYLIGPRGERVKPLQYKADTGAGRAFEFIFPRLINGEPFIRPGDSKLRLEFPTPVFSAVQEVHNTGEAPIPGSGASTGPGSPMTQVAGLQDSRAFLEFKLEKMKFKGEFVY